MNAGLEEAAQLSQVGSYSRGDKGGYISQTVSTMCLRIYSYAQNGVIAAYSGLAQST